MLKVNNKNEILNLDFKANIVITPTDTYYDALATKLYNGYIPFRSWLTIDSMAIKE